MQPVLVDGVICWKSADLAVDADGATTCYHPNSKNGLDKLGNALHVPSEYEEYILKGQKPPHGWAGVATVTGDPHGDPIIQGVTPPPIAQPGGVGFLLHRPHVPGFYVATTSYADRRFPVGDPCRYIDAETVRYVTYTGRLLRMGAQPGDLAIVLSLRSGAAIACVLGDYGPDLGEASIGLCRALGGPADPRHGGPSGGFAAAVFPATTGSWPRGDEEISSQVATRFAPWGGVDKLREAVASR